MEKILVTVCGICVYGVIGYMDEKLLDSCCGLRYISDLRLDYLKA